MRRRFKYVVEGTTRECDDCGSVSRGDELGFWLMVEWSPGAHPGPPPLGRPPDLVLCADCLEMAGIGQLVGPEIDPPTPARGPFGRPKP